jgi:hypothetical protein
LTVATELSASNDPFSTVLSGPLTPAQADGYREMGAYDRPYDEGTIDPEKSGSRLPVRHGGNSVAPLQQIAMSACPKPAMTTPNPTSPKNQHPEIGIPPENPTA